MGFLVHSPLGHGTVTTPTGDVQLRTYLLCARLSYAQPRADSPYRGDATGRQVGGEHPAACTRSGSALDTASDICSSPYTQASGGRVPRMIVMNSSYGPTSAIADHTATAAPSESIRHAARAG